MERLTKPDSDYCHDICGGVNGCSRLIVGGKRCKDYDLYERLKLYEDLFYSGTILETLKKAGEIE